MSIRVKPTAAGVVSLVALFVALGGSAYAGAILAANSVTSKQIAPGAVKRSDIAARAVTGAKVQDGSLLASDFAAGQLPTGPQGPAGSRGDPGPPGVSSFHRVLGVSAEDATRNKTVIASCPAGETAISGGHLIADDGDASVHIRANLAAAGGDGWRVIAANSSVDETWQLVVAAYCAKFAQ